VNLKFIKSNEPAAKLMAYLSCFGFGAICCLILMSFIPAFLWFVVVILAGISNSGRSGRSGSN
jgi:hypothetical protein